MRLLWHSDNGRRWSNPVFQFHILAQFFQMGFTPLQTPADCCPSTKESKSNTYQHFCKIVSFLPAASVIRYLPKIMDQFLCLKCSFSTFLRPPVFSVKAPSVPHSLSKWFPFYQDILNRLSLIGVILPVQSFQPNTFHTDIVLLPDFLKAWLLF